MFDVFQSLFLFLSICLFWEAAKAQFRYYFLGKLPACGSVLFLLVCACGVAFVWRFVYA